MINLKNQIWIEKYRPRKIDDVVGGYNNKIKKYISSNIIPHFLLYSRSPGTGKTSMALAIINELGCDSLILNSSDERKIEVIRERVKIFSRLQSSKKDIKRCIFMDEFDGMLKPSQNALRNLMETYSNNCFFILTCNAIEKVIEPIKSRCVILDLSTPPKTLISEYLIKLCHKENITDSAESIRQVIDRYYPDIRSMVQFLQTVKNDNVTVTKSIEEYDNRYEICFKNILNKKFLVVKDMIFSGEINPKSFNGWMFKEIFKYRNKIGSKVTKDIIQILADNELAFSYGACEEIIFLANLLKIIDVLKG